MSCQIAVRATLSGVLWLGFPCEAQPQIEPSVPYVPTSEAGRPDPLFVAHLDSVAKAIGLPLLRQVDLPTGYRELRLWDGFGIAGPFSILRIVVHGSQVDGEMFKWGSPSPDSIPELVRGSAEMLRRHWRCYGATVSHGVEWCEVKFPPGADWRLVLDRLEKHRVWSLPQTKDIPGHDGMTLVAEILAGGAYRTYDYWVFSTGDPDMEDAVAIEGIVFSTLDEEFGISEARGRPPGEPWCARESEYSKNLLFTVINGPHGQRIRKVLDRTSVTQGDLVLIEDEAECRRLSEQFGAVHDLEDYSVFHYKIRDAHLVVETGRAGSEAEGCIGTELHARERWEYAPTVCFAR